MAECMPTPSDGGDYEIREDIVAAVERKFVQFAAAESIGELVLYGITWYGLEGDKDVYPPDPCSAGCIKFTHDKLAELANKNPECKPALETFSKETDSAYKKRRIAAFLSGCVEPSDDYSDEDFAMLVLSRV